MTQPDLVSKLREFVRAHNYGYLNPSEEGKPGHYWCLCGWEGPDRGSYWKHLDEAILAESLLGLEGQAAASQSGRQYTAFCAEHDLQLTDGRCPKCRDANGNSFVLDMQSTYLDTSTPIVPGTAGLSAFADEIKLLLKMAEDCDARGEVQSPQKEWTFYQGKIVAYKHILSLLGAAKPVGISIDALEDLMQQFKQREARIRKDVLEEAAQLVDKFTNPLVVAEKLSWLESPMTFSRVMKAIADEIRALAERPAPAGEAEAPGPKLKCGCQPIHSTECVFHDARSSQYRHFYPHELGRGEVKGEK